MNLSRLPPFVSTFPPRWNHDRNGPVLVVAAHPDDESVGASLWLLRGAEKMRKESGGDASRSSQSARRQAAVVLLTDGTPQNSAWFGRGHAWNHVLYRTVRRRECHAALETLGIGPDRTLKGKIPDQELGHRLRDGLALLHEAIRRFRPSTIVVPAYEGGHPDHDAANFLVACLRRRRLAPTVRHWWEYALYTHRSGRIRAHSFPPGAGSVQARLRTAEQVLRRRAIHAYRSQAQTLRWIAGSAECCRPLPDHDYTRPPLPCLTVYEQWGMPWTATELCQEFRRFLESAGLGLRGGTRANQVLPVPEMEGALPDANLPIPVGHAGD